MARVGGGVGGVEDRGGVEPDVAASGEAGMGAAGGDESGDIAFGNAAVAVGAGRDQQRGIVRIDGVEMDAQGQHPIEQGLRRGDMLDAGLERPEAEAGRVYALLHGDGAVLMPAERPVGGCALVKEDRADGFCSLTEMGGGVAADCAGGVQHVGEGGQSGEALAGAVGWQGREGSLDDGECGFGERGGDVVRAVLREGEGHDLLHVWAVCGRQGSESVYQRGLLIT